MAGFNRLAAGAYEQAALRAFTFHRIGSVPAPHCCQQAILRRTQAGFQRRMGAADAGVAGKRDPRVGSEDAHPVAGLRIVRRQQEGGFDQVGPGRDGLHCGRIQRAAVGHHAERITAAETGGKDIKLEKAESVHGRFANA